MADEDDRWLEGLAGQTADPTGNGPERQGAVLRAAILARRVAEPGTISPADPQREAVLIARARAAGLLPGRAPHRTLWWAALAATVACVVVGLALQMHTAGPVATLRGDASAVVRIRAEDPLRLKQELLRELNAAGIHAVGYQDLGRQGIDADLPTPLPDAVRSILERHAVPLPSGNVLQLEIESRDMP